MNCAIHAAISRSSRWSTESIFHTPCPPAHSDLSYRRYRLPPRRKAGTATGFSAVDIGGNWLRFYRHGSSKDDPAERRSGLLRLIDVAARQGDSRGDDAQAIAVLDAGLGRHLDAPPIEIFEALLYRAELRARTGADAGPDLSTARALLADHQLGAEAERALTLAVEAELTTEQQNKMSELGEGRSGSNENDSPTG